MQGVNVLQRLQSHSRNRHLTLNTKHFRQKKILTQALKCTEGLKILLLNKYCWEYSSYWLKLNMMMFLGCISHLQVNPANISLINFRIFIDKSILINPPDLVINDRLLDILSLGVQRWCKTSWQLCDLIDLYSQRMNEELGCTA